MDSVRELAAVRRAGGFVEARLTRIWWSRPADVWRAFTDPDLRAQWLAPGAIEPRTGGAVRLDFEGSGTVIESRVSAFEEGRLVEFSWSRATSRCGRCGSAWRRRASASGSWSPF